MSIFGKPWPRARAGLRVGIVAANFYEDHTETLLRHTLRGLRKCRIEEDNIEVQLVPGSFELPLACAEICPRVDAVIALGLVLVGETRHAEVVVDTAARGVMNAMLKERTPIIFGVIEADSEKLLRERLPRGADFARSAVEMAELLGG